MTAKRLEMDPETLQLEARMSRPNDLRNLTQLDIEVWKHTEEEYFEGYSTNTLHADFSVRYKRD